MSHQIDIPFKTLKKSVELMDLSNDAIELGNHNCISDAGVNENILVCIWSLLQC